MLASSTPTRWARARHSGRYLGVGLSNHVEMAAAGSGHYGTEAATIRIEPSGEVNVYIAGGSAGNSLETTVAQLAADALGVEIGDVATVQGDTGVTGFGAGAIGASPAVANAVADALSPFGATVTRLPLGPGQVLEVLGGSEAGAS